MRYKNILNKFLKLLNDIEKDYTVRAWDSGDGIDIVIPHNNDDCRPEENKIDYNILISINEDGYVTFEQEEIK